MESKKEFAEPGWLWSKTTKCLQYKKSEKYAAIPYYKRIIDFWQNSIKDHENDNLAN
jgi:hypothetical protein